MAVQETDIVVFGDDSAELYTEKIFGVFSRHSDKFTSTSGSNIIRVNNQFDIRITRGGNTGTQVTFNILNPIDSSTIRTQTAWMGGNASGTYDAYILKTNNIFYCRFYRQNTTANQGCVFCWIQSNNKNYVSITPSSLYSTPRSQWNIEGDTALVCIEEADTSYRIRKIADYSLGIRSLFFTPVNVLSSSNGVFTTVEDFNSCSNVTYPSVVSVNNKNYYTVGTNTLIELED